MKTITITEDDRVQLALGTKKKFHAEVQTKYCTFKSDSQENLLITILNVECVGISEFDAGRRVIKEFDCESKNLCKKWLFDPHLFTYKVRRKCIHIILGCSVFMRKNIITEEDKVQLALGTRKKMSAKITTTWGGHSELQRYEFFTVMEVVCAGEGTKEKEIDTARRVIKELDEYIKNLCRQEAYSYADLRLIFIGSDYEIPWPIGLS